MQRTLAKVAAGAVAVLALTPSVSLAAAKNPAKGRVYAVLGCSVLTKVNFDASDNAILQVFRAAKKQFAKAATYDSQYRELVTASTNVERATNQGNDSLLTDALTTIVVDCAFVGVDLAAAWGATTPAAPPPSTPPTVAPKSTVAPAQTVPPVNSAPRSDPRNSAYNNDLPTQNDFAPFNFPIPGDFVRITSTLPGRTYGSTQVETTGSQLAIFEQGCKDIGWPVLEKIDSKPLLVDGQSLNAGALACRSLDGGGAGAPAPWKIEIYIYSANGKSVFNINMKRA
jgi:hypothetical protein